MREVGGGPFCPPLLMEEHGPHHQARRGAKARAEGQQWPKRVLQGGKRCRQGSEDAAGGVRGLRARPVQRGSAGFRRVVGCSREMVGKQSGNGAEESDATGTETTWIWGSFSIGKHDGRPKGAGGGPEWGTYGSRGPWLCSKCRGTEKMEPTISVSVSLTWQGRRVRVSLEVFVSGICRMLISCPAAIILPLTPRYLLVPRRPNWRGSGSRRQLCCRST